MPDGRPSRPPTGHDQGHERRAPGCRDRGVGYGGRTRRDVARTARVPVERPSRGLDELDRLLQDYTTFTSVKDGYRACRRCWRARHGRHGSIRRRGPGLPPNVASLTALGWWLIGESRAPRRRHDPLGVLETDGWMLDGRDTDVVLGPAGWLDGLHGSWATLRSSAARYGWRRGRRRRRPGAGGGGQGRVQWGRGAPGGDGPVPRRPPPLTGATRRVRAPSTKPCSRTRRVPQRPGRAPDRPLRRRRPRRTTARSPRRRSTGTPWARGGPATASSSYGLDPYRADQAEALVAAFEAWAAGDGESSTPATTADALDDGAVANTVWTDLEQMGADAEQLVAFLGSLTYSDPGSIGAMWVRARALDLSGRRSPLPRAGGGRRGRDRHGPALIDLAG